MTMTPQWHFNTRRPCDRMRDPANEAFFTAESLENLSEALIREAIQNSLDAALRDDDRPRQVRVRIDIQSTASQQTEQFLVGLFASAHENFSQGLGVHSIDALLKCCGYVVIEDFGTRGLTGDVNECRIDHAEKNAFFSFFRAEGRSAKTGESLGRWGIGKQVFPTASRLHAMFGVTVRADAPARVLMGSAVVRSHSVSGKDFQPDAWFGWRTQEDDPVKPVTTEDFIESFSRAFGLERTNQPGLSVVIPSVDERVKTDDILQGILRSFFWPILLGELVVELKSGEQSWQIDADTLASHRTKMPASEAAIIKFASWAAFVKPDEHIRLPEAGATKPLWAKEGDLRLPEGKLDEIRRRLENDQRVAIRIPVNVRPKLDDSPEKMSYFTLYLETCSDSGHGTCFLRDGIVITDVRSPLMTGTHALVVIDDPPLAGLLGDAEGVNHTQWQKDSPKFHGRYKYGPDTIRFVTRSAYEVLQRLHTTETKGDPNLLLEFFFLPTDEGRIKSKKRPEPGKPEVSPAPPSPPPPRPKRFVLESMKGGFVLKPGEIPFQTLPAKLRLEASYAVRRGNPFKRWASDDFAFSRPPLHQDPKPSGVGVTHEEGNKLELEIRKPDFLFGISGFDTKRDLVVRVIELKGGNETDI